MLFLILVLSATPEVKLPPKQDVTPTLASPRLEVAAAIRDGVKAARSRLARCDGGDCTCAVLRTIHFDVALDGGTLTVSYPLQGHAGPSFTLDSTGRVVDCRF